MTTNIYINYNKTTFPLPNDSGLMAGICSALPENSAPDLLVALASHSSTRVQCEIASRLDLPLEAIEVLIAGGNQQVRRTLVHTDAFKATAKTELLLEWCAADEEFAALVAWQITNFKNADVAELCTVLAEHPNPDVRRNLAQVWQLPRSIRKKLRNDSDFGVAQAATPSR